MNIRICFALVGLTGSLSAQTTWYVSAASPPPGNGTPGDPYASVQYAITQPLTDAGDTVLVLPGTYAETIDFVGKAITVKSQMGAAVTMLEWDLGPPGSVVNFQSGEGPASRLEGFTIRGGVGNSTDGRGAAIRMFGASPTIAGCVLRDNFANALYGEQSNAWIEDCSILDHSLFSEPAAGFLFEASAPTLVNCEVSGNFGGSAGGGAFWNSQPTMIDCTVANNGGCVAPGIWFWNCPNATIQNSQFRANGGLDPNGGGINSWSSTLAMTNCVVANNVVDDDHRGGGIHLVDSNLTFTGGRIEGNFAALGAGVYADVDSFATLQGTLIADNRAFATGFASFEGRGGGVYGPSQLIRCTLARNEANGVGGGCGAAVYGSALLENCTLFQNTALTLALDCGPTLANCIVWEDAPLPPCPGMAITYTCIEGGYPGIGNFNADPLFIDPASNNFGLSPTSPAIDAGDPALFDPDGSPLDVGAIPFGGACPDPATYCTAKTNSLGCVPSLTTTGTASLSAPTLEIQAEQLLGQTPGLFFLGLDSIVAPLLGGTLCVQPPLFRTPLQFSGGVGQTCTGSYELSFTPALAAALGLVPGSPVYAQAYGRDNGFAAPNNVSLTDAVHIVVCP